MKPRRLLSAAGLLLYTLCSTAMAVGLADEPIELRFADFFVQPIGPRGLEPTPRLLAAQGQTVRLVGFMVLREQALPGRFLLTPRPLAMAEHADGEADDLPASAVTVLLPEGQRERLVAHQPGPLALSGRLEFGPEEDASGRVSWLRLHLAPEALAERPANAASAPPAPMPSH